MDLTTAARILEAKRPRYFIFENVPGLLGIEKGQTFKVILETLSELGYCVEWLCVPQGHFLRAQTVPASVSRSRENECTFVNDGCIEIPGVFLGDGAEGVTFCDVVTKTTNQYGVSTSEPV